MPDGYPVDSMIDGSTPSWNRRLRVHHGTLQTEQRTALHAGRLGKWNVVLHAR